MSPKSPTARSDRLACLLEESARGDEQAFALFYEETAERAHGLARHVLKNHALAQEVTQDAYLDAWRLASQYDRGRGGAFGWLLTLVHRRAVDRVRSTVASARRDGIYQGRELTTVEVDATASTALASLQASQVRAALAELSASQRQAITLVYFGGLSHTEVATAVAAPLGTVKFRIRTGLRKLRSALASMGSEADAVAVLAGREARYAARTPSV